MGSTTPGLTTVENPVLPFLSRSSVRRGPVWRSFVLGPRWTEGVHSRSVIPTPSPKPGGSGTRVALSRPRGETSGPSRRSVPVQTLGG